MKKRYFLVFGGLFVILFGFSRVLITKNIQLSETINIINNKESELKPINHILIPKTKKNLTQEINELSNNGKTNQNKSQTNKDSLSLYLFYKEFKNKLKNEQLLNLTNNFVYTIVKDDKCKVYQKGLALMKKYKFSKGKLSIMKTIEIECNQARLLFFSNNSFIKTYSGEGSRNNFNFYNENLNKINELNLKNNSESPVLIKTKGNNAVFIYDDLTSGLKKALILNSLGEIIETFTLEYQNIVDFDIYDNKLALFVFNEDVRKFKLVVKTIGSENEKSIYIKTVKKIELINENKVLIYNADNVIIIDVNYLERKNNLKSNSVFENKNIGFAKKLSNQSIAVIFYELDGYKNYKNIEYYEFNLDLKILAKTQIGSLNSDFDFEKNGNQILITTDAGTFKNIQIEK